MNILILTILLMILEIKVRATDLLPFHISRQLEFPHFPVTNLGLPQLPLTSQRRCFVNNLLSKCPVASNGISDKGRNYQNDIHKLIMEQQRQYDLGRKLEIDANQALFRRIISQNHEQNLSIPSFGNRAGYTAPHNPGYMFSNGILPASSKLNLKLESPFTNYYNIPKTADSERSVQSQRSSSSTSSQGFEMITSTSDLPRIVSTPIAFNFDKSLDEFERKFYATTFEKLTSISPASRRENGMSYVQSGLFLQMALMTFLNEVHTEASLEIKHCIGFNITDSERIQVINKTMGSLPVSSDDLKFRWSSRLVVRDPQPFSQEFTSDAAPAMRLVINTFNGTESSKEIAEALNLMVEEDSGGAIHDTFEEDDFSEGVQAILLTTLYFRARWRSSPTLLNGTRRFLDSDNTPQRTVRMIKINDIMRYADLTDWDAEALEVFYSTPGLSLLMLVPRGSSLRRLVHHAANTSIVDIAQKMQPMRIAVTLPLYTLRMTLLLPNKLEAMGITYLMDTKNGSQSGTLRLSHAVQRIMFWAEAGRNAFKDDGLEWDESPERELMVDRPYIFYVRWKNKTLINGNFVL